MNQLSRIFLTVASLSSAVMLPADSAGCNSCDVSTACGSASSASTCFSPVTTCGAPTICVNDSCNSCYCPSIYIPRSADSNTVLLWGLPFMHKSDMDCNYGGSQFIFEYTRSFNANSLANGLFGACGGNLLFQGSQVAGRSSNALIADYFGLSQDFSGSLALKPVIENFNVHYVGYLGLDRWTQGLWFKVDFTFSHQQRNLTSSCASTCSTGCDVSCNTSCNASCNTSCNTSCNVSCNTCPIITETLSTTPFPAGYMGTAAVTPATSIAQALSGDFLFGDMQTPWIGGRWNFCNSKKNGVAGLSLNLGYDLYNCDENYFSVFFRTTAPTGSKSSSRNVFSAIVGNGQYWEVGGGISGKWEFWNRNDCQKLAFLLDGYVTTLLKSTHLRTFDLSYTSTASTGCCDTSCGTSCGTNSCGSTCGVTNTPANCLSRYVLLKELTTLDGAYEATGNLINGVNFTTRNARVHVNVKGDATLRMLYSHNGFDFGFGYNVYGQTREKISEVSSFCRTGTGFYGITTFYGVSGCRGEYYNAYPETGSTVTSLDFTSDLSNVTASNATAYSCGTADNYVLGAQPSGGNIIVSYRSNSNNAGIVVGSTLADLEAAADYYPIITSDPAVVLTEADLDIASGGAPRQFSNKGFLTFDYTWQDNDYLPYVGFGAEVEGGARNLDLAQWGLWIRGGLSY